MSSEQQEKPCFLEAQLSANEDSLLNDEELVRTVDKEFSFMPSFTSDFKSFRFEENKDKPLHGSSDENNQIVNAKHEELNSIENFCETNFQVAEICDDTMRLEEKVETCFVNSENMVEEMIRRVEKEDLSIFSSSFH